MFVTSDTGMASQGHLLRWFILPHVVAVEGMGGKEDMCDISFNSVLFILTRLQTPWLIIWDGKTNSIMVFMATASNVRYLLVSLRIICKEETQFNINLATLKLCKG